MAPEIVILNGKVLTMDPDRPRAEAVAVASGRIVAVARDGSRVSSRRRWTSMAAAIPIAASSMKMARQPSPVAR